MTDASRQKWQRYEQAILVAMGCDLLPSELSIATYQLRSCLRSTHCVALRGVTVQEAPRQRAVLALVLDTAHDQFHDQQT